MEPKAPTCAGQWAGCLTAPTMIGSKGYVYCAACGPTRRQTSGERTRKMTPTETRKILAGEPLARY